MQTSPVQASWEEITRTPGGPASARPLPRRDYFVLPLLSLLTVAAIFGIAEPLTRDIWPNDVPDACFYWSSTGPRDQPNCTSYERVPESPLTKNVFNACGYRTFDGCGTKAKGTIRIVVFGSSIAEGLLVPMDETYAYLAARELRARWHRPVEFEELAAPLESPAHAYLRIGEALALKPDAVLFILTPIDLESLNWYLPRLLRGAVAERPKQHNGDGTPIQEKPGKWNQYYKRLQNLLLDSRTALGVEHGLFRNRDTFLSLYLLYGDKAAFLRPPFTPAWQERFDELDFVIGGMADKLRSAGIPFFIAAAPSRADAALLNTSAKYPGTDPYAWGETVARIAESHGAHYIDLLHAFSKEPRSDLLFFIVDGHMTAQGQPVISKAVIQALSQAGLEKGASPVGQ